MIQLPLLALPCPAAQDLEPLARHALTQGPATPALLRAAWDWTPDDEETDDDDHE